MLDPQPVAVYIKERMPAARNILAEKAAAAAKAAAAVAEAAASHSWGAADVIGRRPARDDQYGDDDADVLWCDEQEGKPDGYEKASCYALDVSEETAEEAAASADTEKAFALSILPGFYYKIGAKSDGTAIFKQEPNPGQVNSEQLVLHYWAGPEHAGWYISNRLFTHAAGLEEQVVAYCGNQDRPAVVHVPYWTKKRLTGVVLDEQKDYMCAKVEELNTKLANVPEQGGDRKRRRVDERVDELQSELSAERQRNCELELQLEAVTAEKDELGTELQMHLADREERRQQNNASGGGGGNINKMAVLMCAVWDGNMQSARDLAGKYYKDSPIVHKAVDNAYKNKSGSRSSRA